MSAVLDEVLAANAAYAASFGAKSELALPPARRFAILTCMDARLDPASYAGLREGDAHVIRNAGGRASDDAIRSLVISYKLLGTAEWFVIHHTDCGMEFFTDDVIRDLLASSLETAALGPDGFRDVGPGPGSSEGAYVDWLTIADQTGSVVDDVRRIRTHPLVPARIPIYGYVYDVAHRSADRGAGGDRGRARIVASRHRGPVAAVTRPGHPRAVARPGLAVASLPLPFDHARPHRGPQDHARARRPARRDPGRSPARAGAAPVRRAQPVAGECRSRPLSPRPSWPGVLAPPRRGGDPAAGRRPRMRRRRARRGGPRDHGPPQGPDAARRRHRRRAPGGRRPAVPEGGALAPGGRRVRLQARRGGLRRPPHPGVLGPRRGARPGRPAVLPHARSIRTGRGGRRGSQPDPQPGAAIGG